MQKLEKLKVTLLLIMINILLPTQEFNKLIAENFTARLNKQI